jgi:hypothetical protein
LIENNNQHQKTRSLSAWCWGKSKKSRALGVGVGVGVGLGAFVGLFYLSSVGGLVLPTSLLVCALHSTPHQPDPEKVSSLFELSALDIDKQNVSLNKYQGKVLVVVNVASA